MNDECVYNRYLCRKESAGHRSRQDERLVLYDEIYSEVYESTMDKNNQIALVIEAQDVSIFHDIFNFLWG